MDKHRRPKEATENNNPNKQAGPGGVDSGFPDFPSYDDNAGDTGFVWFRRPKKSDRKENKMLRDPGCENTWNFEESLEEEESSILSSHKENVGNKFKINSHEWKTCIHLRRFEPQAKILLQEGTLPGKNILNKICTRYNRKSQIVQFICEDICTFLQQQSDRIVSVWAAYRYYKEEKCAYGNEITFVILTKEKDNIHIDCDYELCFRSVDEISDKSVKENILIHEQETLESLSDDEKYQLKKCKVKNTKHIMDKHSNLTRITLSWFKTDNSGSQRKARRIPCVAIYVQIKGLIPINEDPFTERIEQFPVDIREGVFRLHGKSTDFHENVKMGCSFDAGYGTSCGTIGPLIQIKGDSSFYCLTSSHIVLMDSEFQRLQDKGFIHYGKSGIDVYQPPESQTQDEEGKRYPFGRMEAAIFRQGNETDAGMEVALLKINDDRRPIDFAFPEGGELNVETSYESIIGLSNSTDALEVCKYGGETGLTKGSIRSDGTSLRTRSFPNSKSTNFTLYRQIEVIADTGTKFGDFGDSGSLVLVKSNNRLVPFGIFEGSFDEGWTWYVVTPLADILKTISETLSMHYPVNADHEDMDTEGGASVPPAIRIPLQQVHSVRNIHQQPNTVTGSTAEFAENLLFNTEHKFKSMKNELTEVKKELNELKLQNSKHEDYLQQILERLPKIP